MLNKIVSTIKIVLGVILIVLLIQVLFQSPELVDGNVQEVQQEQTEYERPELPELIKLPKKQKYEPAPEGPTYKSLGISRITAYCPCRECSDDYGTQTATEAVATEGVTIAVDPKVIPYGSIVLIDGKEYIAQDCGSLIDGNDIDIYFDTHAETDQWGVRYIEIFILVE